MNLFKHSEEVYCRRLSGERYGDEVVVYDIEYLTKQPNCWDVRMVIEALVSRVADQEPLQSRIKDMALQALRKNVHHPLVQAVLLHERMLVSPVGYQDARDDTIALIADQCTTLRDMYTAIVRGKTKTWQSIVESCTARGWRNTPAEHEQHLYPHIRRVMAPTNRHSVCRVARHLTNVYGIQEMPTLRRLIVQTVTKYGRGDDLMTTLLERIPIFQQELCAVLIGDYEQNPVLRWSNDLCFDSMCRLTTQFCKAVVVLPDPQRTQCARQLFESERCLWLWKEWRSLFTLCPYVSPGLVAGYVRMWEEQIVATQQKSERSSIYPDRYPDLVRRMVGDIDFGAVVEALSDACRIELVRQCSSEIRRDAFLDFGFDQTIKQNPTMYQGALEPLIRNAYVGVDCLIPYLEGVDNTTVRLTLMERWLSSSHGPCGAILPCHGTTLTKRFVALLESCGCTAMDYTSLHSRATVELLAHGGYQLKPGDVTSPNVQTLLGFICEHHHAKLDSSSFWSCQHNTSMLLGSYKSEKTVLQSLFMSVNKPFSQWDEWRRAAAVTAISASDAFQVALAEIAWVDNEYACINMYARSVFAEGDYAQEWMDDTQRGAMHEKIKSRAFAMIWREPDVLMHLLPADDAHDLLFENKCGLRTKTDLPQNPEVWRPLFQDMESKKRLIQFLVSHSEINNADFIAWAQAMDVTSDMRIVSRAQKMLDCKDVPHGALEIVRAANTS